MIKSTTFKHVGHALFQPTSRSCRPRDDVPERSVESMTTGDRSGTWDRALDGPTPKDAAGDPLGLQLLILVARLGFSLFITAGLAAGLGLYAGKTFSDPNSVWACQAMFFWCLVLITCMTSRRP
jgi:hypothetical protein